MKNEDSELTRFFSQSINSLALPKITVSIDPGLGYMGKILLDVNGLAVAEQYYFAELIHGKPGRMFIVHFEHFHANNEHFFDYPHLNMVNIGDYEFLQQAWPITDFELFKLAEVSAFFKEHGLTLEVDWLVNRYVTVVDAARKHEFILFYLETASMIAFPIEQLQPGRARAHEWPAVERGLIERANQAFTLSSH